MSEFSDFITNYMKNKLNEGETTKDASKNQTPKKDVTDNAAQAKDAAVKEELSYKNALSSENVVKANVKTLTLALLTNKDVLLSIKKSNNTCKYKFNDKEVIVNLYKGSENTNFNKALINAKRYLNNSDEKLTDITVDEIKKYSSEIKIKDNDKEKIINNISTVLAKKYKTDGSWSTVQSEWKKFGQCITYLSAEMLSHLADSSTEPSQEDLHTAMYAAFEGENKKYQSQIKTITQKMTIDAVYGVIDSLKKHGEIETESYKLYEAEDVNFPKDDEEYNEIISNGNNQIINKITDYAKKNYKEEFDNSIKILEDKFDEGRQETIDDESSDDKEKFHINPCNGVKEKAARVGRLAGHGPMTFVHNHPGLEKMVEAIDGQQWNIFNTAAKLMIKVMKLIESGSKGWQQFKEDLAQGLKAMSDSVKTQKINQFKQQIDDIYNGKEPGFTTPDAKIKGIIQVLSLCVRKYETLTMDSMKNTMQKPWFTVNEGVTTIDNELLKSLVQNVNVLPQLKSVYETALKYCTELEKVKPEDIKEAKEQPTEEQPTENKEGTEEGKPAEESKDAEEKPKYEFEFSKWREQKFNFDKVEPYIVKFPITDELAKKLNGLYTTISNYIEGDSKSNLTAFAEFFSLLQNNLALKDGRFITHDEACINTITCGEFMDGCKVLTDKIANISKGMDSLGNLKIQIPSDKKEALMNEIKGDHDKNGPESITIIAPERPKMVVNDVAKEISALNKVEPKNIMQSPDAYNKFKQTVDKIVKDVTDLHDENLNKKIEDMKIPKEIKDEVLVRYYILKQVNNGLTNKQKGN